MISLPGHSSLDHAPDYVHIEFGSPYRVISSAVLNGGLVSARHILNLRVPKHHASTPGIVLESPEITLRKFCEKQKWGGTAVGMMTAASMNSFRFAADRVEDFEIIAMVTSGLSNPLRAGDPAEHRSLQEHEIPCGTVNIIILTTASLGPAAMVEAVMIATEANACVFQESGIRSRVSNQIATGTGTDAIACACRTDSHAIHYCGKHLKFGERLACLVIEALTPAIQWELDQKTNGNA